MTLNAEQQRKVEENLGLVGKVIKDKVHGLPQSGIYAYDDFFQIGCIGLCKAAATDKGGTFSTYAYRLIWNEICDALIKASRITGREETMDSQESMKSFSAEHIGPSFDTELATVLAQIEGKAGEMVANGIRALSLSLDGYSSQEIGRMLNAQSGTVRMWMTKARRYLREQPELRALMQ